METREKKSLALTLIGHGAILMAVFLGAAFIHRPKIEYMEIDPGIGGPKSPRTSAGAPPAPPSPQDETPEPPVPKPEPQVPDKPVEPPKEKSEFVTKKTPPAKKTPPVKKKPVAKKPTTKPSIIPSKKLVVRGKTAKPSAKPAAGQTAGDIKKRMQERLGKSNPSDTPSPGGDGSGNATGTANRFAAYLGGLQEQLQIAWQQPSAAETGLKTEVGFILEKSGHLTGIRVVRSSGNPDMDQSALLAVKSLGAYEPWPEDFTSDLARITVEFECKPNQ